MGVTLPKDLTLTEVVAWGDVAFLSLRHALYEATNLVAVPASSEGIEK